MREHLVTIAIPAYKAKWLAEAIESALNQDYENIELIVVDDHSPNDLEKIVTPYLSDKRVRYYKNDRNLGKESIVLNWNRCLELAEGEFFVLLCDDDLLLPNFVSELLKLAEKYPQCDIFHGSRMLYHEKTNITEVLDIWPEYESFDEFVKAKAEVKRKHTITEFLYRSRSIMAEKYIVFPVGYFSDDASILRMVKKGGIASSQKLVCKNRINDEQISSSGKYAVEKVKATLLYYEWYKTIIAPQTPKEHIKNAIDDWAYRFYSETTITNKLRILLNVPNYVWPLKQKLVLFLKALFGSNQR